MIRRLPGRPPGLLLEEGFLRAWLEAAGLQERLHLAFERLPRPPERAELWDLWLELQAALLQSRLPESVEEALVAAVGELGERSLSVQAVPAEDRKPAPGQTLQAAFPRLQGTAAVLEAVRLAWAAVLSMGSLRQQRLPAGGRVSVRREGTARAAAAGFTPNRGTAWAGSRETPDPRLLRLAELHNRLLQPDSPLRLQSLLDLRLWLQQEQAAPDEDEERQLLRASEAAGIQGVPELLRLGREAWAAWVATPATAAPIGQRSAPPAPLAPAGAEGRYRQLAGASGAPGLAVGPARLLRAEESIEIRPGEILVCGGLPPACSVAATAAAGLLTEQGGRLSYGAVLAARAGIPCVCGARGALAAIRNGDLLLLDGKLGIAGIRPVGRPA